MEREKFLAEKKKKKINHRVKLPMLLIGRMLLSINM